MIDWDINPSQVRETESGPGSGRGGARKAYALAAVALFVGMAIGSTAFAVYSAKGHYGDGYLRVLGRTYASAWRGGAKKLDAGESIKASYEFVRADWQARRIKAFAEHVSPMFEAAVPAGKPEGEVTKADRKALADAWRKFANSLE